MDQSIASYCPFIRNRKWYWPLFLYSAEVSLCSSWLLYRSLEENCSFLDHILQCHICKHTGMQRKIIPSAKTVFHNNCISKWFAESLDLMGWIILSVLMRRSQDVHSMGKQRNINAPSVTLSCMIIVYQLFMDLESDLLQSCN